MASAKQQRYASMFNAELFGGNKAESTDILRGTAGQGLAALGAGGDAARGALTSYGGQAYGDVAAGYGDASRRLGDASTLLNLGRNQATSYLDQVPGLYQPYAAAGAQAQGLYSDALGLNGAPGNARATEAFTTGPGYEFQRDEALRGATRQAAATGRLDGGGTLAELTRIGNGLASQEWNNWLTRLQGQGAQGMQAASGIAGGLTNLGNIQFQQGQGQAALGQAGATLDANRGTALAGINTGLGTNLGNSFTNQGAGEASVYGNLGSSLANLGLATTQGVTQGVTNAAQAGDAAKNANQNLALGLTGQILGLGLGGGNTVGGSMISGLTGLFKAA